MEGELENVLNQLAGTIEAQVGEGRALRRWDNLRSQNHTAAEEGRKMNGNHKGHERTTPPWHANKNGDSLGMDVE